jgi:acetyl-CoA synthetase
VLNVSGRLIGTAEIESALVLHEAVAEAAVVAIPHDIKGSQVVAFVVAMRDTSISDTLPAELTGLIKEQIGSFAKPDRIILVEDLPKTRSGKIMRRILRTLLLGETDDLGDTSTLADSDTIDHLIHCINPAQPKP